MRQDSRLRVLMAITTVMDDYGIEYQHVRKSNHLAIQFSVGGQTRTLTYSGGDPRAHLNARSQARRLLHDLGLKPIEHRQLHTMQLADEERNGTNMESERHQLTEGTPLMEDIISGNQLPIEDHDRDQQPSVEQSDETQHVEQPEVDQDEQPINESVKQEPEIRRFADDSYVLLNTVKYHTPQARLAQNRFIAIKLDRDLLVSKGHYLVIPVDVPDVVWDMPEHEYKSCFTVTEPHPVPSRTFPAQDTAQVRPPDLEPFEANRQPELTRPVSEPHFPPKSVRPSSSPKHGVSPQMGRVLLAMLYLHEVCGETEIAGTSIQSLLSPVDQKQVSGMLSGGIKMRYVTRGSALDAGRGSHYMLNAAGKRLARNLRTWPYDHRDLAVPDWLNEMFNNSEAQSASHK